MDEPLAPATARGLVRQILSTGSVRFSSHSLDEMDKDGLSEADCVNVLRGGFADPPDFIQGTWRYRMCTPRIVVVITFRSETQLMVVTAWRKK